MRSGNNDLINNDGKFCKSTIINQVFIQSYKIAKKNQNIFFSLNLQQFTAK